MFVLLTHLDLTRGLQQGLLIIVVKICVKQKHKSINFNQSERLEVQLIKLI